MGWVFDLDRLLSGEEHQKLLDEHPEGEFISYLMELHDENPSPKEMKKRFYSVGLYLGVDYD